MAFRSKSKSTTSLHGGTALAVPAGMLKSWRAQDSGGWEMVGILIMCFKDPLIFVVFLSPMLTPGWEPEGPAQKNSQGVPWILLDISTTFFIPAAVSYMLGLYRNFIRRIPLLSNIKVHGFYLGYVFPKLTLMSQKLSDFFPNRNQINKHHHPTIPVRPGEFILSTFSTCFIHLKSVNQKNFRPMEFDSTAIFRNFKSLEF